MRRVRIKIATVEKAIIIIITYSEYMFLALGIQHAKRIRSIIVISGLYSVFHIIL